MTTYDTLVNHALSLLVAGIVALAVLALVELGIRRLTAWLSCRVEDAINTAVFDALSQHPAGRGDFDVADGAQLAEEAEGFLASVRVIDGEEEGWL